MHDQMINRFISLFAVSSTYLLYLGIFVLFMICSIIFRYRLASLLALLVVCSFCGIDFKSLGRHTWRCDEKLRSEDKKGSINPIETRRTHVMHQFQSLSRVTTISVIVKVLNVDVERPVTVCVV